MLAEAVRSRSAACTDTVIAQGRKELVACKEIVYKNRERKPLVREVESKRKDARSGGCKGWVRIKGFFDSCCA